MENAYLSVGVDLYLDVVKIDGFRCNSLQTERTETLSVS